jgi:hypothetical protein
MRTTYEQKNGEVTAEIPNGDADSQQTPPRKPSKRAKGRKIEATPSDFLPRVRVGRLRTVNDWLLEYGKVYRAVRRGVISTADGGRLAYMAATGKEMAKAVQELQELASLRTQLEALNNGQGVTLLPRQSP